MGESSIITLNNHSLFGFGIVFGKQYGQWILYITAIFWTLEIEFKKKTASNRWFSISKF